MTTREEVLKRNEIHFLVHEFFERDMSKVILWFHAPNHALGGETPMGMLDKGETERLLKFIEETMTENASNEVQMNPAYK
jgi:hypothetical protein